MSRTTDILNQYSFNASKPTMRISNLDVFDAKNKETNLPYTIKIIKNPEFKLEEYLKKMKDTHSDYVIKILQFAYEVGESRLVIVQEHCGYGTLKKALSKCRRLDDDDCVFVSKMLLNAHIDLLRNGVNWFGDENDIEFTANGLKLSWNNSMLYNEKCPFPELLTRIGMRESESSILPFPKNKMLIDLIAVSKQNASEISLHPILKKKDKILKKKGKNWIAIREFKTKGEYFQQLSYLAISTDFGFVRVKIMETGDLNQELMKIHQTKASFVKILDYYEEKDSFYTVSEYANDGTVQNYVKRLKNSNTLLKQSQIQFFFYSVIQPLKFIHNSSVKSLNTLHIRNIYIENGIPKIGEPVLLNQRLKQTLIDRADVPDFYHNEFKTNPSSSNSIYDTYSLGVLLYKLMYTEYPIFPQGKVHIPTAPNYKKNLKAAIELFLNVGGNLEELQKQLEISDDVKLQVKNNEKILDQVTKKNNIKQINVQEEEEKQKVAEDSEIEFREQRKEGEKQNVNTMTKIWRWITNRGRDSKGKYAALYNSEYDGYRKCTTVFIVLLFYFFAFFLVFMNGLVNLFNYTRLFTPFSVNILGENHRIITPNIDEFLNTYDYYKNGSILVLNETMHCRIDDKNVYYDFVRRESPHWHIYLVLSLIVMIVMLTLKGIQLCKYSTVKAGFHHYDTTITGSNLSRFALSTFVFVNLWFGFALYAFYFLFNYIYHEQHLPCFGGTNWTMLTETLFSNRVEFSLKYLIVLCIVFFFALLSFVQIIHYHRIRYTMLKNPIFVFTPCYLCLFIMLRIGAYEPFVPSFSSNEQKIIGSSYMAVIGYFPEILIIIELMMCLIIDYLYYRFLNKSIQKFVLEQSHSEELKLNQ